MTIIGSSHNEGAIANVREFLILKARNNRTTTYEEAWAVARKYGDYSGPHDPQLWHMLGVISARELDSGRPPLSVLVTHKSGERHGFPGVGFFSLMKEKGCEYKDEATTFSEHSKSTFDYWAIH